MTAESDSGPAAPDGTAVLSDAVPPSAATRNASLWNFEVTTFAVLFLLLGALAYYLFPSVNTPETLAPGFSITVDGASSSRLTQLVVTESHPAESAVTLMLDGSFSGIDPVDRSVRIVVEVPSRTSTLVSCSNDGTAQPASCAFGEKSTVGQPLEDVVSIPVDRQSFSISVSLQGISGLGFAGNTHVVDTQFPILYTGTGTTSATSPVSTLAVGLQYRIPNADKFNWSGTRPSNVNDTDAIWYFGLQSPFEADPDPATSYGSRDDLLTHDSNLTFITGALLGLAGAALIAGLQAVFVGAARRRRRARKLSTSGY